VTNTGIQQVSGTYTSNDGTLVLYQDGASVAGTSDNWWYGGLRFTGTLTGRVLNAAWYCPNNLYNGMLQLVFSPDGKSFTGGWGWGTSNSSGYNGASGWIGNLLVGAINVSLSPGFALLLPGQAQAFHAAVSGGFDPSFTWSATGGTVDSGGNYTAPTTPGVYSITATSIADPTKAASATIQVTPDNNLQVSGSYNSNYGNLVIYQNGSSITVTSNNWWYGNLLLTGTLTGRVFNGSWYCSNNGYTGLAQFVFSTDGRSFIGSWGWGTSNNNGYNAWTGSRSTLPPAIAIQPTSLSLSHGQTQVFQGGVSGLIDDRVVFASSNGTITQDGIFTAPASAGTATVTLTSVSNPALVATAQVYIIDGNPEASLIGHWCFDEGSGTTAFDSTGNHLDGNLHGVQSWVPGRLGSAIQSDGLTTYMEVPSQPALNPGSMTLSLWLNLSADPNCNGNDNWRSILHKGALNGNTAGYDVILGAFRNIIWETGTGTLDSWSPKNLAIPVGTWTHLVLTYDARTGVKNAYQDGTLRDTHTVATPAPLVANATALRLNNPATSTCPAGSGNFNGAMDDLRIYSRALSASEVATLYGPIIISPRNVTLKSGQTANFMASWTGTPGTQPIWGTNGGSITASGTFTAPGAGTYTVTAYTPDVPGLPDQTSVTVQDYDVANDFSATQNPNGPWTLGMEGPLGGALVTYTTAAKSNGMDMWWDPSSIAQVQHGSFGVTSAGTTTTQNNTILLHPGSSGQYSVMRWTAPQSGTYAISTGFYGLDTHPTSTDEHVLVNGKSIWDGLVTVYGFGPNFSTTLSLQTGDQVDFVVGFGANKNYYYDSTGAKATINLLRPAIDVEPAQSTVLPGGTVALTATPIDCGPISLLWSVQEGPSGGLVSVSGTYTAPTTPGIYHVVATSPDGSVTGIATVIVRGQS
jgi:hypothetical protein